MNCGTNKKYKNTRNLGVSACLYGEANMTSHKPEPSPLPVNSSLPLGSENWDLNRWEEYERCLDEAIAEIRRQMETQGNQVANAN